MDRMSEKKIKGEEDGSLKVLGPPKSIQLDGCLSKGTFQTGLGGPSVLVVLLRLLGTNGLLEHTPNYSRAEGKLTDHVCQTPCGWHHRFDRCESP